MARPRKFDESAVLTTARDRFWSTGYAGTSVDDIAAATGLGKGSLYGAFGDKHQLFLRVFDDYCTQAVDAARRSLDGPDDQAYERLCGYIRGVAASTAADSSNRGCLLAKGTAELSEHDPDVAARALKAFDDLERLLATDIRAAQRHGDLDPDTDPTQLAALLLAVLRGTEALGKAGKKAATLHAITNTAIALLPRANLRQASKRRRSSISTNAEGRVPRVTPPAGTAAAAVPR
jgi:TetR/AcrR family transcriptional regulator, transcriptional repressor for nem operon